MAKIFNAFSARLFLCPLLSMFCSHPSSEPLLHHCFTIVCLQMQEIFELAWEKIIMRPTKQQVVRELTEWKHNRQSDLLRVARFVADGTLQHAVDDLIRDIYQEEETLKRSAEGFAAQLLVGAVASSCTMSAGAASSSSPTQAPSQRPLRPGVPQEDVYNYRRTFSSPIAQPTSKQLYIGGLRAMLKQMRAQRPPDTPFGHTQQLQPEIDASVSITRAQRLAISRMRAPLSATAAVWRRREGPVGKIVPGSWPRGEHVGASLSEADYWLDVRIGAGPRPPVRKGGLQVPPAFGPITAVLCCPLGNLMAVGTSHGGVVVYDLRVNVTTLFRVLGDGKKDYVLTPTGQKEPHPPIVAFAWSADSYQLSSLDANGTVRMWWMRTEKGARHALIIYTIIFSVFHCPGYICACRMMCATSKCSYIGT